jgi:hypothetical protein
LGDETKVRQVKDAGKANSRRKRVTSRQDLHVAGALRKAYDEAVSENIPSEFLDLLGRLK